MAADIDKEISKIREIILKDPIKVLQAYLDTVDRHFFEDPVLLEKANRYIKQNSEPRRGKATPDASQKQFAYECILFCQQKLLTMQPHLQSLLTDLDDEKIMVCLEKFLWEYDRFKFSFDLLLDIVPNSEAKLKLWDISGLVARMRPIVAAYAEQMNPHASNSNDLMFNMDSDDFTTSSDPSSSSDSSISFSSSSPTHSVHSKQKEKCNKAPRKKTQLYSASFFSEDIELIFPPKKAASGTKTPPENPLSIPLQDTVLSDEKKPQDAISFLSEILKKTEELYENVSYLCDKYKRLHYNQENRLYKSIESKLIQISTLIHKLKKNLSLSTEELIESDVDCADYKEDINSIVKEMMAIIQDPKLEEDMHSIYEYILRNMLNRQSGIRPMYKISYVHYQQGKKELSQLYNDMEADKETVRPDIKEMREKIKEEVVEDVFGSTEIEPSTYNSQFFSTQKRSPADKELTKEENKIQPLTFEKEYFPKEPYSM